jgi:hypothetical protein
MLVLLTSFLCSAAVPAINLTDGTKWCLVGKMAVVMCAVLCVAACALVLCKWHGWHAEMSLRIAAMAARTQRVLMFV